MIKCKEYKIVAKCREGRKLRRKRLGEAVQAQGVRGWGAVRALLLFQRALAGLLQALGRGEGCSCEGTGSTASRGSVNQSSLPQPGKVKPQCPPI